MPFYADLHIHSKYSRATSSECDLEHLAIWAARKGLSVVATGDFTHPAWLAEIRDKLVSAEPGLFRLRPGIEREVERRLEPALKSSARFLLSAEISTIYKKGDKTRKVHHLILVPDLKAATRLGKALARIGNIASDGRPILGLDSRSLLEITLEAGEGAGLIPAHIWTPWFSMLGSKSGFDSIEECYGDLSPHIFALETGLSSDPAMNWRLSALDPYRLVSNSDAHSPAKLGREACVFDTELDYFIMLRALKTGQGYGGTIEFFPEEGKYHLDGHRKCGIRLSPEETRKNQGRCPGCGKPVTVGVMNRVEELADRPDGARPKGAAPFASLIPLAEIIGEVLSCGAASKAVVKTYDALVARLGPELYILHQAPLAELRRLGSDAIGEAVSRMRQGRVIRAAGYDGEYGVIKLFEKGELDASCSSAGLLFELPPEEKLPRSDAKEKKGRARKKRGAGEESGESSKPSGPEPAVPAPRPPASDSLSGLDPDQAAAALAVGGPLLIIAGPGAGKTRTLTHRIARLVSSGQAAPGECLAITFTRRAAAQMRERLLALLPGSGGEVPVMTFHQLGLSMLTEHGARLGLPRRFRVAADDERAAMLMEKMKIGERKARSLLAMISRLKRTRGSGPDEAEAEAFRQYEEVMKAKSLLDFDDLIALPVSLLESDPGILSLYRQRYPWISIDEYQDIDESQYRLVKLLAPPDAGLCAIGDPDQAIYGFRGSDVGFFLRFQEDFPGAKVATLTKNYRTSRLILDASMQMISPGSLAPGRSMEALMDDPTRVVIAESATDKAEAEFVAHSIERMIGGSAFFSLDSGRVESEEGGDFSFADFAVLYRTEAQAAPIAEALSRLGVPFQMRSHRRFAEVPMVEKIVAAMRGEEKQGSVSDALKAAADAAEGEEEDGRVELEAAVEMLSPLAARCGDDFSRFLSELALGVTSDDLDPRADRVSLLTLHAAKGLEFRVVFITGCEDGLIPLSWGRDTDKDEERRLFFVGMTRARERLFLCRAGSRLLRGKVRKVKPSPFLRDIEDELLDRQRSRGGKKKPAPGAKQLDLF